MIVIEAYLRRNDGTLTFGRVALERRRDYGRRQWFLADTIVTLAEPRPTELRGWHEYDEGPATEMHPLVIPEREMHKIRRVEQYDDEPTACDCAVNDSANRHHLPGCAISAERFARLADECHGYDIDGNPIATE